MIIQSGFSRSEEEVLLVSSVLRRLDSGKLGSLAHRILCQKIQYLAQHFKITPPYSYGLYLHGPYSPDLAKDLFFLENQKTPVSQEQFLSHELEERFMRLKEFVQSKDLRSMEIITTLHWLLQSGFSSEQAILKIKELKKATPVEIKFAQETLQKIP